MHMVWQCNMNHKKYRLYKTQYFFVFSLVITYGEHWTILHQSIKDEPLNHKKYCYSKNCVVQCMITYLPSK